MSSYSNRDTYSQAGDWLLGAARRNPEALPLMAAGCCLMMRSGRSSSRAGARVAPHMRDEWDHQTGRAPTDFRRASASAREGLSRAGESAADTAKRAGDYASQVKDRITDTASDYASQMKDRISDTASSYADSVADFAGDARRRAKPKRRCNRACSACCASNSSPSRSPVWRRVPRSPRYFPRPTSRTAHSAARTKLARTWTQGALQSESTMVVHHSPPEHNAL